jgi:hypothetical protein
MRRGGRLGEGGRARVVSLPLVIIIMSNQHWHTSMLESWCHTRVVAKVPVLVLLACLCCSYYQEKLGVPAEAQGALVKDIVK